MQATPIAKKASSQVGALPSSTESVIAPTSKDWANAIAAMPASTTSPISDSWRIVCSRSALRPRMFCTATKANATAISPICTAGSSVPVHIGVRYFVIAIAAIAITMM
jgi:hypothetical protein